MTETTEYEPEGYNYSGLRDIADGLESLPEIVAELEAEVSFLKHLIKNGWELAQAVGLSGDDLLCLNEPKGKTLEDEMQDWGLKWDADGKAK